jgi:hypothetical protein
MKNVFLMALILLGNKAFANEGKKLVCTSGTSFERLEVSYLSSVVDQNKLHVFHAKNVTFIDNYLSADLTCSDGAIDEIRCTGFAFNQSSHLMVLTMSEEYADLSVNVKFYDEQMQETEYFTTAPWPCVIKEN